MKNHRYNNHNPDEKDVTSICANTMGAHHHNTII